MKDKPVRQRTLAQQDVESTIAYYLEQDAEKAALGFIDALELAYSHLSRHPSSGSTRYAHELDLPELRSWSLKRYPHIVFYVENADYIDVWRVLNGLRDIPAWLGAEGDSRSAGEAPLQRQGREPSRTLGNAG